MRKFVTGLIVLAVAGGAYYYFFANKEVEQPQIVQAAVSQGDVTEVVKASGTLEAIRTFPVGSQVSGLVKAVYVDFNSIVKKDQLIAEIDPSLLQVQVDLQKANVARQEGEIANQQVQLEDAEKQRERTQMMFDKGLANQQQLDQAVLTVKTRTTSLDAARKQLLTTQANLSQAELNLSYTKVYAPIDGVVVNRLVDVGQFVQSSMTSPQFFTIATDLRELKLSAGVDEAEIGKIRRGQKVNFTVDTYPNMTFEGTVEQVRLNATTQQNVVTYPVWINVRNPDLRLRPYLTATVDIVVQTAPNVLRVPNQATRFRPTADMYTALGLTPPAPGGRAAAAGANGSGAAAAGGGARGDAAATEGQQAGGRGDNARTARGDGAQGTGARGQGASAQAGQNGGGRQGGRGFGANLSPEERERMRQQFAAGGGGRGGRGRNGGGQAANQAAAPIDLDAEKIDDLYAPMQARPQGATVYQWDPATKQLTEKRIQIGITDGTFSQILGGDLKVGDQLVTNIIVPVTDAQRQQQQQNIFNQGRGGFGQGGPQRGGGGGGGGGGRGGRGGD